MRPTLSFDHIAVVLSALGASAIVACSGKQPPPPVHATEVAPSASSPAAKGHASCGAGSCGGKRSADVKTGASPHAQSNK